MTRVQRRSRGSESTLDPFPQRGSVDDPFEPFDVRSNAQRLKHQPKVSPQVSDELHRQTEGLIVPLELWEVSSTDESAQSLATRQRGLSETAFRIVGVWDGVVTDVHEDAFTARVMSLVDHGTELEVEFSSEDLDPDDLSLLKPGAIFYWHLGYQQQRPRRRVSELRFRRVRTETPTDSRLLDAVQALFLSPDQSEPAEG